MNAQSPDDADRSRQVTGSMVSEPMPHDDMPTASAASAHVTSQDKPTQANAVVAALPLPGSILGRYRLITEVSRGGMGVVFRAHDPDGKVVALKTVRRDRAGGREFAIRFAREVKAAQQLKHANVMPILDVGEAEGYPFFTMELLRQGSLSQHRARFQGDPRAAVCLIEQVARGVQHAHDNGIHHRDLKPGNILLADGDIPRVSDFGLAKIAGSDGDLTRSGQLLGTTSYMAPEQATGRIHEIGARSDLWALGVVLYELLAGRRPFVADDEVLLIQQIQNDAPTPPSKLRPELPPVLDAIVLKCLEKKPDERYGSAGELADDLAKWLEGKPPRLGRPTFPRRITRGIRRHPLLTAVTLLALAAVVAAAVVLPRLDPERGRRQYEEQLARGDKVTWIPEKGLPDFPPVTLAGPDINGHQLSKDGYFTLSAVDGCLGEFLPDPKCDRYRIHGWVRQNDNTEDGLVGFYFGHSKRAIGANEVHCYVIYGFAETDVEAGRFRLDVLQHSLTADGLLRWSRVQTPTNKTLPADQRALKTWRELTAEVTPEQIVVSLAGVPLPALPRADLNKSIRRLVNRDPNLNPPPAFAPREGLGLFVYRGSASFQSVTIQPMPAANP